MVSTSRESLEQRLIVVRRTSGGGTLYRGTVKISQLNLILILDEQLRKSTERLAPHLWVLSPDKPHTISGNLELQGPVVDTISNWLHADYLPT